MQDFNVLLEAASDYNEFVGSGAEEDRNLRGLPTRHYLTMSSVSSHNFRVRTAFW